MVCCDGCFKISSDFTFCIQVSMSSSLHEGGFNQGFVVVVVVLKLVLILYSILKSMCFKVKGPNAEEMECLRHF